MLPLQFRRCGAAEKKKKKRRAASSPVHAQRERGVCARKARQERSLPRERSSLVKNTSLGKVPSWGARNLRRKNVLWEEEESRRRRRGALFVVHNFFLPPLSLPLWLRREAFARPQSPPFSSSASGSNERHKKRLPCRGRRAFVFVFPFFRLLGTSDDLASPRLPPPSLTRQFLLIPPPPSLSLFLFLSHAAQASTPNSAQRTPPLRGAAEDAFQVRKEDIKTRAFSLFFLSLSSLPP